MDITSDKAEKLERDAKLIRSIADGDDDAWAVFVEQFTDWTLYKAKEWCTGHCRYRAGGYFCGLASLQIQRNGSTPVTDLPECDEGLDTYIWLFEQLKRKTKKYSGKK